MAIGKRKEIGEDDRVVKTVKQPPMRPINPEIMYPDSSKFTILIPVENPTVPNLEAVRKHLFDEGSVAKTELIKLVKDVTQVMSKSIFH
jgi:hypothetical protein